MEVKGVTYMSTAIFEETKKDIKKAYQNKSTSKIEKETPKQAPEERIHEVNKKLLHFQKKYKAKNY